MKLFLVVMVCMLVVVSVVHSEEVENEAAELDNVQELSESDNLRLVRRANKQGKFSMNQYKKYKQGSRSWVPTN